MRARRGMIEMAAIACALSGCCQIPAVTPPPSGLVALTAPAPAVEPSGQTEGSVKTFTIAFATFIPADHLLGPVMHPQSYERLFPPSRLAFAGDGRGFDVDATSFRAKQVVTVVPDEADDAGGLVEGSKQNLGGVTESFGATLEAADRRDAGAGRSRAAGNGRIKHTEVAVDTGGMVIDGPVRLGPHRVFVRLRTLPTGGPRNALIKGSPSIDWDIGVTIDTSGPVPTYHVAGTWDGYPAAELYINRQPVLLLEPNPGRSGPLELLKLLPGLADYHFVRTGILTGLNGR